MSSYDLEKVKIMVVDDIEINRIILEEILSEYYEVEQAADGLEAVSKLLNSVEKPNLVLLDIMMPGMDGIEVLQFMKADPMLKKIPVIFITAADKESAALRIGAIDYISKPFEPEIVKLRVANHIELNLYRERLEGLVEAKANELVATKETFLETMASMIEYRSLESGEHIQRTKKLMEIIIFHLLKNKRYAQTLKDLHYNTLIKAVPLHDIGKIGIPDNILLKPGRLTPEEFKIIETHTVIGGEMIKSMMLDKEDIYLKHCYDIARFHHERWDGNGYPDGLSAENIPLSARIMSVIDVYDALVSKRCYKQAFPSDEALNIIKKGSGSQFDPDIVEALFEMQEQIKGGAK